MRECCTVGIIKQVPYVRCFCGGSLPGERLVEVLDVEVKSLDITQEACSSLHSV